MYLFSKPSSARPASIGKKITTVFGYMLIIFSLCSVIIALFLPCKSVSFFHQNVTTAEFHFYIVVDCCLLLAPEYAQKSLATEILTENSFGHTFFFTLVLSKVAGYAGIYSSRRRVTIWGVLSHKVQLSTNYFKCCLCFQHVCYLLALLHLVKV